MKVYILKKNKTIEAIKTNDSTILAGSDIYVAGSYARPRVDLETWKYGEPEVFFFEGNASPIMTGEEKDPSLEYLEEFIILNAIEQAGKSRLEGSLKGLIDAVKPLAKPQNFFMFLLGAMIILSLIRGWLGI